MGPYGQRPTLSLFAHSPCVFLLFCPFPIFLAFFLPPPRFFPFFCSPSFFFFALRFFSFLGRLPVFLSFYLKVKFLRLVGRALLEQSDVVMSTDIVQALMLAAAQQSMSVAIEGFNLFSDRTYTLASATGSGARYAWYHDVSQTSPSNFFQHVHTWLIAQALWYSSALKVQV